MTTKQKAADTTSAAKLPPITVGKFEAAAVLLERLYEAHQEGFIQRMQDYRDRHREVTRRPLSADEATRYATAMREVLGDQADSAEALQQSDLYAYDEPQAMEVLAAAGLATAPALIDAARQFTALIEMPRDAFAKALDDDRLEEQIAQDAAALNDLTLTEARERAAAALGHFGEQTGAGSGEAVRSLIETVTGALEQAALRVTAETSQRTSSTDSLEPTAGPAETS